MSLVIGLVTSLASVGCGSDNPFSTTLPDDTLRANLEQHFAAGMTEPEVQQRLDEFDFPRGYRWRYPASNQRGPALLARRFRGGFWPDQEHDWVQWLDITFVFDDAGGLERTAIFRDEQRYYLGDPVGSPQRAPMGSTQRFPIPPPPPLDPLEGAR